MLFSSLTLYSKNRTAKRACQTLLTRYLRTTILLIPYGRYVNDLPHCELLMLVHREELKTHGQATLLGLYLLTILKMKIGIAFKVGATSVLTYLRKNGFCGEVEGLHMEN